MRKMHGAGEFRCARGCCDYDHDHGYGYGYDRAHGRKTHYSQGFDEIRGSALRAISTRCWKGLHCGSADAAHHWSGLRHTRQDWNGSSQEDRHNLERGGWFGENGW